MSEEVERRLVEVLNHPTTSPYGNPIPGLDELGVAPSASADEKLVRLSDLPTGQSVAVVVRRLSEHIQTDPEIINQLREAGVVPDARVTVETKPGAVIILVPGHEGYELSDEMAHAVQVKLV